MTLYNTASTFYIIVDKSGLIKKNYNKRDWTYRLFNTKRGRGKDFKSTPAMVQLIQCYSKTIFR